MNNLPDLTRSLRSTRARALAPRLFVYFVLLVVCLAGARAIVAGPAESPAVAQPSGAPSDPAAEAFAEGFAGIYLSWEADDEEARERALLAYLPAGLDAGMGLVPAPGTSQRIAWTAAMGARRSGGVLNVSIAARTTDGETLHLVVPVARDDRGYLAVAGYPALVGAPPLAREAEPPHREEVADDDLEVVVERALTNYLAGARENLLADLAPDAVVALPALRFTVTTVETPTWVIPNHRLAVVVGAEDQRENAWTLRYELDVRLSDRWYVRGIEVDPTLKGGA